MSLHNVTSHVNLVCFVVLCILWQECGSNARSTGHEPAEIPLLHPAQQVLHTSRCFSLLNFNKKQKTLNKILQRWLYIFVNYQSRSVISLRSGLLTTSTMDMIWLIIAEYLSHVCELGG